VLQPPTWRTRSPYLYLLEPGWPSYTSRHRVPILVAFYDMHGLQWDYSFPRSPHGDWLHIVYLLTVQYYKFLYILISQAVSLSLSLPIKPYAFRISRSAVLVKSRDSSVDTVLGYGLDYRGSRVRFSAGAGSFSLHHRVQNGSGAHPASCPRGTGSSFPGGEADGAWSWPLTSF
jgi:hypothetical protein